MKNERQRKKRQGGGETSTGVPTTRRQWGARSPAGAKRRNRVLRRRGRRTKGRKDNHIPKYGKVNEKKMGAVNTREASSDGELQSIGINNRGSNANRMGEKFERRSVNGSVADDAYVNWG